MKRAYPDTPLAMHYRPFDEIDWCALLGADEVVLVITPVFLREVDEHKDHKRGALQQRARRMSSWLGELRKKKSWEIRRGVRVEVSIREPELDVDFAAHGLQPTVNDDKLVACMVRDAVAHPNVPLVCVTTDNALGYKVEGAGFEVAEPPELMRIPDEPDQAEREKRELQKELVELKKRVAPEPDLAVRFADGATHVTTVRLSGLQMPTEEDLDEEIDIERSHLELRDRFLPAVVMRAPSAKAVERYLEALRAWMVGATKIAVKEAHTFDVKLALTNAGMGNANHLEVDLKFPDNIFVSEVRKLPVVQERPTPPLPQDVFSQVLFARVARIPRSVYRVSDRLVVHESVRIDTAGSAPHRLRVLVDFAKHQSTIKLPRFHAWFDVGQRPLGFTVDYRIHAASSPNIQTGTLNAKVEISDGPYRFSKSKLGKPEPDGESDSQEDVSDPDGGATDVHVEDDQSPDT